jgi:cbb3-type cytochrome oxidase maturation protein
MESLYLLIPLSVVLVLGIAGVMVWAVMSGQFENLEQEGTRILERPDEVKPAHSADEVGQSHSERG